MSSKCTTINNSSFVNIILWCLAATTIIQPVNSLIPGNNNNIINNNNNNVSSRRSFYDSVIKISANNDNNSNNNNNIDNNVKKEEKESTTMSAQERILREAGLWEEDDEKTSTKKEEKSSSNSDELDNSRRRNLSVAAISTVFALTNFFWQYSHPVTETQLLANMQKSSAPVTTIGQNGKPSVVDFWAPWCENCRLAAPTLSKIEEEYKDKVNFVMINGGEDAAWPYIEAFGVDAIPHLALVDSNGDVQTALIGPIPKSVLEADLDVLLRNANIINNNEKEEHQPLPFVMLDVFKDAPAGRRRVHFDN